MESPDEVFLARVRDQREAVDHASQALRSAEAAFRQILHDAQRVGAEPQRIAEISGLPVEQVVEIAARWPSLPGREVGLPDAGRGAPSGYKEGA
jgi:hypothetical protein